VGEKKTGLLAFVLKNEKKKHVHGSLSRKITLMEMKDGSEWSTMVD